MSQSALLTDVNIYICLFIHIICLLIRAVHITLFACARVSNTESIVIIGIINTKIYEHCFLLVVQ